MNDTNDGRCIHGKDGDWHGIAGDFLPCDCCGGPVSTLGPFAAPPICRACSCGKTWVS